MGGRLHQDRDQNGNPVGPVRLFDKKLAQPGLAMSRTIGDWYAHTLGCTCLPDITHTVLDLRYDKAVVIASDGVWNVMTPEEVARMSMHFYEKRNASQASKSITKTARSRWNEKV